MTARARLGSAALVLGVAVALMGSSWRSDGAVARDTTPAAERSATGAVINVYSFLGRSGAPIRGLVSARFRGERRSVRVGDPAADAFSWGAINGADVRRPPGSARSVRVYDRDAAGQLRERDCASGEATGKRR